MSATPLRIAYTVSSSYSGSTLLSMLLNAQPDIGTISEFDARADIMRNPDFMCSCGRRIRSCPFFTELESRVVDRGIDFSVERLHDLLRVHEHPLINRLIAGRLPYVRSPRVEALRDRVVDSLSIYRRLENRFFARNAAVMETILDLQNATVFADANKDPHRMLLLRRRFDVRPIYIFKNGIAGVYSMVKNAAKIGTDLTVERASHRWFREQIAISHALRRMKRDFLQLSYSELCTDVEGALRRITDFVEVGFEPVTNIASTEHHIVGNRMRLGGASEIREDVSWRESLSENDIETYRRAYRAYSDQLRAANPGVLKHIWH